MISWRFPAMTQPDDLSARPPLRPLTDLSARPALAPYSSRWAFIQDPSGWIAAIRPQPGRTRPRRALASDGDDRTLAAILDRVEAEEAKP